MRMGWPSQRPGPAVNDCELIVRSSLNARSVTVTWAPEFGQLSVGLIEVSSLGQAINLLMENVLAVCVIWDYKG
jgi:hypothetical protein